MSVAKEDPLPQRRTTGKWLEIGLVVFLVAICCVGMYYAFR